MRLPFPAAEATGYSLGRELAESLLHQRVKAAAAAEPLARFAGHKPELQHSLRLAGRAGWRHARFWLAA